MQCTVTVNGKPTSIAPQTNLATLLQVLGQDDTSTTVALNRCQIPARDWARAWLRPGDSITILQLISG